MKKIFTKTIGFVAVIILFVGITLPAGAQTYTKHVLEANAQYTAMARDNNGNIYVIRSTTISYTGPAEVVKYLAGQSSYTVILTGLTNDGQIDDGGDDPVGLAVNSAGDVYLTTDFAGNNVINGTTLTGGSYIIKLAAGAGGLNSTSYTASVYQSSAVYYTSLAFDTSDNLYALQMNSALTSYTVVEYPKNTAANTGGNLLITGLNDFFNSSNPSDPNNNNYATGLAVASNGDIYVNNPTKVNQGSPTPPSGSGGDVRHYTKSSSYASFTDVSTNKYAFALAVDPSDNLYIEQTDGSYFANYELDEYTAAGLAANTAGGGGATKIVSLDNNSAIPPMGAAPVSSSNIYALDGGSPGAVWNLIGPPSPANNVSFSSTGPNGTTVSWSNGTGASRAVFMAATNTGAPVPVNGTTYVANTSFGNAGSELGASIWYCVYNGTGTSVSVTALSPGTTYRVMVVEYNGTSTYTNYATGTGTNNPNNVTSATPTISHTGSLSALSTTTGTASSSTSVPVSGSNLVANITATVPSGFDVSLDNSSWSVSGGSKTITQSGGNVTAQPVYVRLDAGDAVNSYSGNLVLTSTSATTVNVAIPSSTVSAAPTTISSLSAVTSTLTNATSVQYTATFAASITGLTTSNFALTTTGSVSGASVSGVSGSGTSWTVTVNTGSGDGTIQLSLNNATGLSPSVSNVPFSGATYNIDKTGPAVTISAPSVTIANSSASISYTVTWTDPNLNSASLSLSPATIKSHLTLTGSVTANPTVTSVPASSSTYTVTFTNVTGDGTLAFTVPAGSANDFAGNSASASNVSTAFTVDNTAPTIGIGAPSASITATNSVTYTVTYADANFNSSTLGIGNITLNKTNTANGTVGVSGSGTTRTVTISGITGDGTLGISIASGTATDFAGNSAPSAGPSTTFTVDNTAPTIGIGSPSVSTITTGSGSVTYTVTYGDTNFNSSTLGTGDITLNSTGDASGTVGVSGSGNTRTVTISSITGSGTLGISIAAGTATDLAGNSAAAAGPSSTFSVTLNPEHITFNSLPTTTYGDADYPPGATSDNNNVAITYGSDHFAVAFVTAGKIHIVGAGTAHITAFQAGDATHSAATPVTLTLTVNMAPLTITADDQNSAHFRPLPTLTASYSGFVYSDNSGSLTTLPTIGTTAVQSSPIGTYPITVSSAASSNYIISYVAGTMHITPAGISALTNLTINHGASLTPAFDPAQLTYTSNVPYSTNQISLTPACDTTASVTVNGISVSSGTKSQVFPLNVGDNTLTTVVTADDATTTTYTVVVTRAGSPNAYLSNLKMNSGSLALSPAFRYNTTAYTATVTSATTSVTVTPAVVDSNATIKVNGTTVISGTASPGIPLVTGTNVINTVVTAADGVSQLTYTITVTRPSTNTNLSNLKISSGTLTPAFHYTTTNYTASVTNATTTIKVTPASSDPNATIKVNGASVLSGNTSAAISLAVGANTITTVVTAQDGVTTKTYTIIVNRPSNNANLSNLKINNGAIALSPGFNYNTTSYNASVANTTASVRITPATSDPNATVSVNGTTVISGTASASLPLAVGPNTITTVVTAQDGLTTKTYTITVTRAGVGPMAKPVYASVGVEKPLAAPTLNGEDIVVHQGVSPNGDGINDGLVIDGITAYPDNKLMIMNRNGAVVYEAKGYDNASKIFDGHSNKNGALQLPGTYFYSLDFTVKGIAKHKTGFIILKY